MPSDAGFLVGLVTYDLPKFGTLVWIATPTFDEEPTRDQVKQITAWRWPIFFPLAAAIRRRIATPIGMIAVPATLQPFPIMRSGNKKAGWRAFTETGGIRRRLGPTDDASLPIYKIVNDTRLKEMVVSGWRPEDEW
jgi:hypothetical protein